MTKNKSLDLLKVLVGVLLILIWPIATLTGAPTITMVLKMTTMITTNTKIMMITKLDSSSSVSKPINLKMAMPIMVLLQ